MRFASCLNTETRCFLTACCRNLDRNHFNKARYLFEVRFYLESTRIAGIWHLIDIYFWCKLTFVGFWTNLKTFPWGIPEISFTRRRPILEENLRLRHKTNLCTTERHQIRDYELKSATKVLEVFFTNLFKKCLYLFLVIPMLHPT